MTIHEHCCKLGTLLGHFHSLELLLRSYLNAHLENGIAEKDYYSFGIGSELTENALTNYDSLGMLIDKTNKNLKSRGINEEIDKSLVEIRDALAHGRVSAEKPNETLRLIKFSKPKNGKVKVEFNAMMTENWLVSNRERVSDAIQILVDNF